MALLLSYEKIGLGFTLRVDAAELESLALKLQSSALVGRERAEDSVAADLAWIRRESGHYAILLHGQLWMDEIAAAEGVYVQSDHLLDELARAASPGGVFLHAGAVVSPQGSGLVFSGHSGAGKTSLVTACIARGWQWLSDEALCFDPAEPLAMRGLKRNFNLKRRSFAHFPQLAGLADTLDIAVADSRGVIRFFNPESLGPQRHLAAARLDHFVFPEFDPQASAARLELLPQLETAERIGAQLQGGGRGSFSWLVSATRGCPAHRLIYRDPHSVVDLLDSLRSPARP